MSYDIKGFTVTLSEGIGEDYFERLKEAIILFDGVISVDSHVDDIDNLLAKNQIRIDIHKKLFKAIYEYDESS